MIKKEDRKKKKSSKSQKKSKIPESLPAALPCALVAVKMGLVAHFFKTGLKFISTPPPTKKKGRNYAKKYREMHTNTELRYASLGTAADVSQVLGNYNRHLSSPASLGSGGFQCHGLLVSGPYRSVMLLCSPSDPCCCTWKRHSGNGFVEVGLVLTLHLDRGILTLRYLMTYDFDPSAFYVYPPHPPQGISTGILEMPP